MSDPNAAPKSPSPFAAAISYAEGGPKAAGYALNNPGDLMTNGQLNSYSSLDEGWAALESQIGEWTSGTSKHASGDTSLADLGHIYTGNDNPEGWSAAVAQKLGLSPQNTVSDAVRASGQPRAASTASAPVTLPDDDQAIREKVEAYTQQELQRQNSALQAHIAAAAEKDPNITAEAQRLGLQVGVGADIASRNMAVVRKMSLVNEVGAANLPQTAPRLAKLLEDPEFSGVAYDDLNNLSRIDQSAQAMRAGTLTAPTLAQRLYWNYEYPVDRALMKFGPTRAVSDVVGGATEMVGDIGSFFGLHGNGPTRENWLQRQARGLTPERYGLQRNQGDTVVGTVAPMLPALLVSGGTSALADTGVLSENAAKVLAALGVGGMFTAQQGGETFTRMAAAGKSDAEARHDADVVAGINAIPNVAMGLTDFVPGLRDYPLLSALGIGGATGAAGQLAQNRVTGQPWQTDLGKGALEGAAVQGGMHLGFDFLGQMGDTIDAVQASKLRARSPEQFQRFAEAQFEGDPSLRIPAQEFVDYFQKKNIDPAAAAHQVGVSNLDEAAAAGSDLEIPKANFFAKLDPEHQKGLLPDVTDPTTDLTAKQFEAGRAELQDWAANGGVEKLAQEFQQADAETQASPEWQKAYSELKQRYVDAGEKEPVADTYATKDANAYSYFARNTGQTLDEVMKLHAPKIVAAAEAPGMVLHQGPVEGGESALKPGEPLYQEGSEATPDGRRGWMQLVPQGPDRLPVVEIGKTKLADFSTFIHEPAHAYLELFRTMSQRADASDQLKSDYATIAKALGTTPEEIHTNGFTRAQHELWARMNEHYVREGKAPNSQMQRVFQHFSVWLHRIYRQAKSLGVEMGDDIHGVMDRLYAGEQAVDRAARETARQPLFEKPEDAGWTEEEFRRYAESNDIAVEEAKAQVVRELNEAAEREHSQERSEEARNVREAVTQQIDASPEYTAIRNLRRGTLDDGTALTLNKDALVQQFGEERVNALQKLHRGLYRNEGGTDAETAAELLGFHSGEEMLRALEAAPRRGQAIAAATRDYLVNKYGDVRYDGTLDDRARFAIENKERGANIYRELKALRAKLAVMEKKAADTKTAMAAIATEPLEHYQDAARAMIDQKAVADLQPYRYLNASRKYSREAFEAAAKGNVRKAAEAKQKELLNHFLFREASEARDYAEKFEKYTQVVQRPTTQQKLGLADQNAIGGQRVGDYRDQHNWLLARYKLGPVLRQPERSLRDWADAMQNQGKETAVAPGLLSDRSFADWRSVPLSEVHDLHNALVNIRHLAGQEFKMYVQGRQVKFVEGRAAMVERARETLRTKPEFTFEHNRPTLDRATDPARYVDARLMIQERIFEWLDGGKTGPFHDNIWNPISDAQGDEDALQHEVTHTVLQALETIPPSLRRRLWTEKVSVEGVPEPLTRRNMLSIAFNMGNEGNLDRLQKTFDFKHWDRDAIRKIGGMLTREEWQFVQKVWDALKPLGVRANDLQRRLTGLPLKMVEIKPFKVALDDGTEMELEGGYYPIVYDPKHVVKGYDEEAAKSAQNAMQAGYVRATTSKGYTKERTGSAGPLLLDYERALTSHVAKVTKDLSHREAMLATQHFLLDQQMIDTLRETIGPKYQEQMMPWLRAIINDNNGSIQERMDTFKDLVQKSRANFVTASLSFNPGTTLLQISHAPRMLLYARPASLVQSLIDFLAHPVEATQEIRELSPNEMRFRGDHLDRDLRGVLQKEVLGGYEQKIAVAGRFALQVMDHLLSHTLWRAAFNDAVAKYGDLDPADAQKKAVYEADSAVRLGLGAHAPKDLPAIMRNNEFNKFITTLYGFHNGIYNQFRDIGHQFRYDGNVGKLTYAGILTAVLPAVLGSWLTGWGPKDGENPGWWAAKRSLLFSADTVPIMRAVASAMEGGRDVQFSPIENVLTKGAQAAMQAASNKDDKDWLGIGLNEGEAVGDLFGVPGAHQTAKTLRYIHRANQGKIQNPNVYGAFVGGR